MYWAFNIVLSESVVNSGKGRDEPVCAGDVVTTLQGEALVILLAKAPLEVTPYPGALGDGVVAGGRRQHSGAAIRPSRGQICCPEEAPAQA